MKRADDRAVRFTAAAPRGRLRTLRKPIMLYTIAVVLLVLWLLGLATSFTAGGLLHILLVLAIIAVVYQLITGRSAA